MKHPKRWLLIFTDTVRKNSYWNNLSPLLALTETAVVRRKMSEYQMSRCSSQMSEGCQFKLAINTLVDSLDRIHSNVTQVDRLALQKHPKLKRNKLIHQMTMDLSNSQNSLCGSCDRLVLQVYEKTAKKTDLKPWLKRKPTPPSVHLENQDFDVKITQRGEWTPTKGFASKNSVFPVWVEHAKDFANMNLKVAIFEQRPRIWVKRGENGECIEVKGSTVEIIKLLAERLNFTITWVCTATTFGNKKTDKWSGVMELLESKQVDMAGNPFWKLPSWKSSLVWSRAFTEESAAMMVQKSTEDHDWMWMLPFTWDVWYCLILSVLIVSPFIWYVNNKAKYYDYNNIRRDKGLFSLVNCLYYTYGAFVGQGGDYLPPCITTRTIVAFWWLFVIVVATTYSGNLVACLTFPKVFQPIQNAQDLLNAWFMSWATQEGGTLEEVTKIEKYQSIAQLRPGMEYYDFERYRNFIYDEVGHDSLAWIGLAEQVRHYVSTDYLTRGVCRMHRAKDDVYRAPVYFVFRNDFGKELVTEINNQLMDLGAAGFIVHWMKYYAQLGNDCLQPTLIYAGDVRKIELLHVYGSYVILGFGMAASAVIFALELGFFNFIRPHLPHSWKTKSNANAMDYYNKIFIGYGYSNVRAMSPVKKKAPAAATTAAPTAGPSRGAVPAANAMKKAKPGVDSSLPGMSREMLGSATSRTGLYDSGNKSGFNAKTNFYNNYNYGVKSNFKTKFGMT